MAQQITQAVAKLTPQQQNQLALNAISSSGLNRIQGINGGSASTVFPASNPVLTIRPENVGLIKRFRVIVSGVISNTGTVPINLTDTGISNVLSNVQYTDTNNFLRINTSGLHLTLVANAKRRRPYGGVFDTYVSGDQMLNIDGSVWPVISAPAQIAVGATGNFRAVFEVPLAYSDDNLNGAIYGAVLNVIQSLQLTFNTQAVVASPTDNTYACYSGAAGAAGAITSASVIVYQEYIDNLPICNNSQLGVPGTVLLPSVAVSTAYELRTTNFTGITQNTEFYIQYANARSFLSTFAIFNSTGAQGGRNYGTDVNYWALLTANASYIKKVDPLTQAQIAREALMVDLPAGSYYFPSREKYINSLQYGNMQLVLQASASNPAATVSVMWEDFAPLNTLTNGASLASS